MPVGRVGKPAKPATPGPEKAPAVDTPSANKPAAPAKH